MNRKIKDIWNYKVDKNKKVSLRKKGLKWLAIFMAVMVFCTILSRAANAVTIPKVTLSRPEKKSIDHTVTAQGRVVQNREEAVNVFGNIRVKNVLVSEGEHVSAGNVLFELDMDDLEEKLLQCKNELQKQDYQLMDSRSAQAASDYEKNLARQRAEEDYNQILSQTDKAVNDAYQEMIDARDALNNFLNQSQSDESNHDSGEDELRGDYEGKTEDYNETCESGDNSESRQETMDNLQAAYDEKKSAYENALQEKDQQILQAARAVEDANKPTASDSSEDTILLDRELKEREIAKLEELVQKEGKITSPVDGLVNKVNVVTGEATPEGVCILLADTTEGGKFKAQIPSSQEKYISLGDKVTLEGNDNEVIKDLTVSTISEDAQDTEMLDITVQVPKGSLEIGTLAKLTLVKSSETYQTCVPLSAIRQDGSQAYVLIAVLKDTILGQEYEAQRVDVIVSDKNEEAAALAAGSISSDQMIIVGSDKNIEPGDKIRPGDKR